MNIHKYLPYKILFRAVRCCWSHVLVGLLPPNTWVRCQIH